MYLKSPLPKLSNPQNMYSDVTVRNFNSILKRVLKDTPTKTIRYLKSEVPYEKTALSIRTNEATAVAVYYREQGLQDFSDKAYSVIKEFKKECDAIRKLTDNEFSDADLHIALPWTTIVTRTKKALVEWRKDSHPEYIGLCTLIILENCVDGYGCPRRNEYLTLNQSGSRNVYKGGIVTLGRYKTDYIYGEYSFKVGIKTKNLLDSLGDNMFSGVSVPVALEYVTGSSMGVTLLRKLRICHHFLKNTVEKLGTEAYVKKAGDLAVAMGHSLDVQQNDYKKSLEQYKTIKRRKIKEVEWNDKFVKELEGLCNEFGNDFKGIRGKASKELLVLDGPKKQGLRTKSQNEYIRRHNRCRALGGFKDIKLTPAQQKRLK